MNPIKIYKVSGSASPNSEILFSKNKASFYWNDKDFKKNQIGDLVVFINKTKDFALWTRIFAKDIPTNYNSRVNKTSFSHSSNQFEVDGRWESFIEFKVERYEAIPQGWNWTKQIGASSVYDIWKPGIENISDRIQKIDDLKMIFHDGQENDELSKYESKLRKMQDKSELNISQLLERSDIIEIANSDIFHYAKAQEVLNELMELPMLSSWAEYDDMIQKFSDSDYGYSDYVDSLDHSSRQYKILEKVGELIAHMDLNGSNKANWNRYDDKRTLARLGIRQHTSARNICRYLFEDYSFENVTPAIRNMIQFLLSPKDGLTVASEKHRKLISENLIKRKYNSENFFDDLNQFFEEKHERIEVKNEDNLSVILSRICYDETIRSLWDPNQTIENDMEEAINGLVVCDNTGWIELALEDLEEHEYRVLWWDKMPSGGRDTLAALRSTIKENGFFEIYYTVGQKAVYKSRIIDFATEDDFELKNWNFNHDVAGYFNSFADYFEEKEDGRISKARWVFLCDHIEKLSRPVSTSNFKFYEDYKEPTQNNMQPFTSVGLQRKIWWVCQGDTYTEDQGKNYLWAPLKDKRGVGKEYWDNMNKVVEGDIIFNYSEGLKGVSIAKSDGYPAENPYPNSNWDNEGTRVDIELLELEKVLSYKDFMSNKHEFDQLLTGVKGPFDVNGKVKQGYLFEFNKESGKLVKDILKQNFGSKWLDDYFDQVTLSLDSKEYVTELSASSVLKHICNYIRSKGFRYSDEDIANFYLSLKSKPFAILAGISGTGKTQLAIKFAEAIETNLKMVPVRPDWTDNSDLIGYVDLRGKFRKKAFLESIIEADLNPEKIYFVVLDEMNLARVEHYFSDFLSIIETRDETGRSQHPILSDSEMEELSEEDQGLYNLRIPDNMYIIGTVNMDETTHPFSRKVLDRANSIEMNQIDLDWIDSGKEIEPISKVYNDFLKAKFIFSKDFNKKDRKDLTGTLKLLQKINDILKSADLQFGYRVRDEVCFYMLNRIEVSDIISEEKALDFQIMQKVLPRIQGSSFRIRSIIIELLKALNPDNEKLQNVDVKRNQVNSEELESIIGDTEALDFERSTEKLLFMFRRFEEDGFTSFWL